LIGPETHFLRFKIMIAAISATIRTKTIIDQELSPIPRISFFA